MCMLLLERQFKLQLRWTPLKSCEILMQFFRCTAGDQPLERVWPHRRLAFQEVARHLYTGQLPHRVSRLFRCYYCGGEPQVCMEAACMGMVLLSAVQLSASRCCLPDWLDIQVLRP